MKFKNKLGEAFSFIHLGSRMTVAADGVELSDLNRQLLYTAIKHPDLEVDEDEEGQAVAENIVDSFEQQVEENPVIDETPYTVKFHNTTEEDLAVIAMGSRHTVGAGKDLVISGTNKELVAAALLTPGLEQLSDDAKVKDAKVIAEKRKKEIAKEQEEALKVPAPKQLKKEQVTASEASSQRSNLSTATSNAANNPRLENEEKVALNLEEEMRGAIKPNEGNKPAGNLRIV